MKQLEQCTPIELETPENRDIKYSHFNKNIHNEESTSKQKVKRTSNMQEESKSDIEKANPSKDQKEKQPMKSVKSETQDSSKVSNKNIQNQETPLSLKEETKSSPILTTNEKLLALNNAHSLDSKKVNDAIGLIDIECICKCLAHAILKHIAFSKGKVLIDDLAPADQDIPEFSYEFGKDLKIDLEEIKRRKEEEAYEKYQNKMENYLRLQEMMRAGDPNAPYYYNYENEDLYEDDYQYYGETKYFADEQYRLMSQGVMYDPAYEYNQQRLPPLHHPNGDLSLVKPMGGNSRMYYPPAPNGPPSDSFYNYALVQMDDFLKDEGISDADSTALVNSYYNSLALMQQAKPFLFPPADLGVIESVGSVENSSKYMGSVNSNKIIKAKDCSESLKINMSKPQLRSQRNGEDDQIDEEIPCEIEDYDEEDEEDEEQYFDKDMNYLKVDTKNVRRQNRSPIVLSNYSDSLKSLDSNDFSAAKNSHKFSTDGVKESYYVIEDITKEGLQKFLRDAMKVFNDKYSVDDETFDKSIELIEPDFRLVYKYCKYVVLAAKMEKEIPIVALVYLERLLSRTGILINQENWRRLVLVSL